MSDAEVSVNVECPAPPSYYKYYFDSVHNKESQGSDSNTLQPPSIDSVTTDPYSLIYNGALAQIREKARPFDTAKDYKAELKTLLKSALIKALSFTSYNDPQTDEITDKVLDFKSTLVDIHKVLEEYRVHEARELLCNSVQTQLGDIKSVEESLERAVARAQFLIDGA
jgi:hypothetical protein